MAGYKFRKAKYDTSVIGDRVKVSVNKHPFMLFGLPFIAMVVVGSFMLTPATAIRYEHYDKKSQRSDKKEAIEGTGVKRRYFDPREEYYVRLVEPHMYQRLILNRDWLRGI